MLGGGRYDGLMESLGGPATPAVGWAAGIERLAMLVGERDAEPLEVVVVAEHRGFERAAIALVSRLRVAGVRAEISAVGSPKKRYKKALDLKPAITVSMSDFKPGPIDKNWRLVEQEFDQDRLKVIEELFRNPADTISQTEFQKH